MNRKPTTDDDVKAQLRVRAKIDLYILPILVLLYLFSFLDRSSIGNAKVAGMDTSLNMEPSEFNWGLSIFFVGYIIWEVPSNFLLKNWGASRLIPLITIVWAIITILLSIVKTGPQLIVVRFFLGMSEAGLFPGILYYLTLWYTKTELALRFAVFFGAATLAGAFGGLFAAALVQLDGTYGIHGWQWIFIIEGIATIIIGIIGFFYLPDSPKHAWFLTKEEREVGEDRVRADNTTEPATLADVIAVVTDWKTWFFIMVGFCGGVSFQSSALFLPSIVNGLGFSKIGSQLCSAPPYFISFIVLTLNGMHSDSRKERGYHTAFPMLCGTIGYVVLLFAENLTLKYLVICFNVGIVISYIPILLSWISNNFDNSSRRAIALAFINSVGNMGGFVAGQIYRDSDRPRYFWGHTICAILCFCGFINALLLKKTFMMINQRRRRNCGKLSQEGSGEQTESCYVH